MSKTPPSFTGVPVTNCRSRFACRLRDEPDGTPFIAELRSDGIHITDRAGHHAGYVSGSAAFELESWMRRGFFFTCKKTGRVHCDLVCRFDPIKPEEQKTEIKEEVEA